MISPWLPNPITIDILSTSASATVIYLVMAVIFFLPSSPSFCSSSILGIAIPKSCIIIEEVIYGVILNANTEKFNNEPPVTAFIKLKLLSLSMVEKYSVSTPGIGRILPILTITSISNVKSIFILISLTLNAFTNVLNIKSPRRFHQAPQFFLLL